MSLFTSIANAILGRVVAPTVVPPAAAAPASGGGGAPAASGDIGAAIGAAVAQEAQATIQPQTNALGGADIAQLLEQRAAAAGQPLNWRTSIVDLLKLLGIDSSLQNRAELARELGIAGDFTGTADQNLQLHREVMRQLAANGGNVPASLTA